MADQQRIYVLFQSYYDVEIHTIYNLSCMAFLITFGQESKFAIVYLNVYTET